MIPPVLSREEASSLLYAVEDGCFESFHDEVARVAELAAQAVRMGDVGEMQRLFVISRTAAKVCRRGNVAAVGFYVIAYVLTGAMRWHR